MTACAVGAAEVARGDVAVDPVSGTVVGPGRLEVVVDGPMVVCGGVVVEVDSAVGRTVVEASTSEAATHDHGAVTVPVRGVVPSRTPTVRSRSNVIGPGNSSTSVALV